MQQVFVVGDEPVPGYKLLERLGGSAFYRLWKVRAPDGSYKLWKEIDLVVGNAAIETRTLGLLVQLRHPYLNTLTNFWQLDDGNTLVIETEVPLMTMRDRLEQSKKQGKTIPIEELRDYLDQAADGLDFLNAPRHSYEGQQVAIYHRALTLDSLLLFHEGNAQVCKVSDFGLAKPVTEQNAQHSQGLQHYDYDPPEFFEGRTAPTSDQYALAVNYYELRTGLLPFPGTMLEQLQSKLSDRPDLSAVQEPERSAIRKALSSEPTQRYESCMAFAQAVRAVARSGVGLADAPALGSRPMPTPTLGSASPPTPGRPPSPAAIRPAAAAHLNPGRAPETSPPPGVVIRRPPPELDARNTARPEIPGEPAPAETPARANANDVMMKLRHGGQLPARTASAQVTREITSGDGEGKIPLIWVLVILALVAGVVYLAVTFLFPAPGPTS